MTHDDLGLYLFSKVPTQGRNFSFVPRRAGAFAPLAAAAAMAAGILLSLAGRALSRPWPPPQWRLGFFCPSPGGRFRTLGRRRNGGWDSFVPRRAGAFAPLAAAAMAAGIFLSLAGRALSYPWPPPPQWRLMTGQPVNESCVDGPCVARRIRRDHAPVGCSHVSGLFARPLDRWP